MRRDTPTTDLITALIVKSHLSHCVSYSIISLLFIKLIHLCHMVCLHSHFLSTGHLISLAWAAEPLLNNIVHDSDEILAKVAMAFTPTHISI